MQLRMLFIPCILLSGCTNNVQNPVRIYAAVSIAPVLEEILESSSSTESYIINAASSSLLAQQIQQGANADIFASASIEWVHFLEDTVYERWEGLGNELVLIKHKDHMTSCSFHDNTPLSIADWNHVPAGIYAKKALKKLKLFDKKKEHMIPAMNAHAALSYVSNGHIPCGIVYKSDTLLSEDVEVLPSELDDIDINIQYSLARIRNNPRVHTLFQTLYHPKNKAIYERSGFTYNTIIP